MILWYTGLAAQELCIGIHLTIPVNLHQALSNSDPDTRHSPIQLAPSWTPIFFLPELPILSSPPSHSPRWSGLGTATSDLVPTAALVLGMVVGGAMQGPAGWKSLLESWPLR